jgi:hypothetical protein
MNNHAQRLNNALSQVAERAMDLARLHCLPDTPEAAKTAAMARLIAQAGYVDACRQDVAEEQARLSQVVKKTPEKKAEKDAA